MSHTGTRIYMTNVPGSEKHMELHHPLAMRMFDGSWGVIPEGYRWDGSSVPWIFRGLFPRHDHPIASCRHDWRCVNAKNREERAWADKEFEQDVGTTSNYLTKKFGYIGVRIGALTHRY
jgi:hypothetical protein